MRPRWHEWVISLSIVALAVGGIFAIWGEDIQRLFQEEGIHVEVEGRPSKEGVPEAPSLSNGPRGRDVPAVPPAPGASEGPAEKKTAPSGTF
ncbi:MAG: hypothetical protein HY698_07260 [Deltaproteobacteria bacterium]|nr:hypothetical protein [Deltaproteobacteria bacterium]